MTSLPLVVARHATAILVSLVFAVAWVRVIDGVHDGQTWWSGISSAQQELTFVSEQAFYYYYFKRAIRLDKTLGEVVTQMIYDDTVEYPTICNAFHRFNIYPELVLAVSWRSLASLGVEVDPLDFYKYASWGFVGLLPPVVYLLAYALSDSLLAACLGPVMMFANFHESTRAPSGLGLRETIAIPLVFLQFAAVLNMIGRRDKGRSCTSVGLDSVLVISTTTSCLLSWQLCGNLFLLQTLALLGVYAVGHLPGRVALHALLCHAGALGLALALLFGNLMLALSWYSCVLVSFMVVVRLVPEPHPPGAMYVARALRTAAYTAAVLVGAVALRTALTRVVTMEDDAHIFNLVRAKLGTFQDFHTTIYLRIAAFQGLPWEQYPALALSGMLSGAAVMALLVVAHTILTLGEPQSPVLGFLVLVCLAHCVLANLFLRLKFLWTPLLCVLAAVLPARLATLAPAGGPPKRKGAAPPSGTVATAVYLLATAALAVAPVYSSGNFAEVRRLLAVESSYNREVVLALIDHIRRRTPPDAVIFGDMITTSAVVTMAGRRVAIHPHYEGVGIRSKIYRTYHWAAYRRLKDVHQIMVEYNVTHVVDCPHLCYPQPAPSYAELIEQGEYGHPPPPLKRAKVPCCRAARKPNKYFELLETVADKTSPDENIQFWLYRVLPTPS